MSIHQSLRVNKWKSKRNVRKRFERFRSLVLQNKWDAEHDSIYALPKERIFRLKAKKKEKEEKKEIVPFDVIISKPIEKSKSKKKSKDVGKIK